MLSCSFMPCGHLPGKGWPLGPHLWCLIVKLSLSYWYPGLGVVLDCIDCWSLSSFLLLCGLQRSDLRRDCRSAQNGDNSTQTFHLEITFYGSTKFPTYIQRYRIYLPKWKFWIQLSPKWLLVLLHPNYYIIIWQGKVSDNSHIGHRYTSNRKFC